MTSRPSWGSAEDDKLQESYVNELDASNAHPVRFSGRLDAPGVINLHYPPASDARSFIYTVEERSSCIGMMLSKPKHLNGHCTSENLAWSIRCREPCGSGTKSASVICSPDIIDLQARSHRYQASQ